MQYTSTDYSPPRSAAASIILLSPPPPPDREKGISGKTRGVNAEEIGRGFARFVVDVRSRGGIVVPVSPLRYRPRKARGARVSRLCRFTPSAFYGEPGQIRTDPRGEIERRRRMCVATPRRSTRALRRIWSPPCRCSESGVSLARAR